jgi:hypothetical protein
MLGGLKWLASLVLFVPFLSGRRFCLLVVVENDGSHGVVVALAGLTPGPGPKSPWLVGLVRARKPYYRCVSLFSGVAGMGVAGI